MSGGERPALGSDEHTKNLLIQGLRSLRREQTARITELERERDEAREGWDRVNSKRTRELEEHGEYLVSSKAKLAQAEARVRDELEWAATLCDDASRLSKERSMSALAGAYALTAKAIRDRAGRGEDPTT